MGSERKRECLNLECRKLHLKGTRRYPPPPPNIQDTTQFPSLPLHTPSFIPPLNPQSTHQTMTTPTQFPTMATGNPPPPGRTVPLPNLQPQNESLNQTQQQDTWTNKATQNKSIVNFLVQQVHQMQTVLQQIIQLLKIPVQPTQFGIHPMQVAQ